VSHHDGRLFYLRATNCGWLGSVGSGGKPGRSPFSIQGKRVVYGISVYIELCVEALSVILQHAINETLESRVVIGR
jgi:hypothetical protein